MFTLMGSNWISSSALPVATAASIVTGHSCSWRVVQCSALLTLNKITTVRQWNAPFWAAAGFQKACIKGRNYLKSNFGSLLFRYCNYGLSSSYTGIKPAPQQFSKLSNSSRWFISSSASDLSVLNVTRGCRKLWLTQYLKSLSSSLAGNVLPLWFIFISLPALPAQPSSVSTLIYVFSVVLVWI